MIKTKQQETRDLQFYIAEEQTKDKTKKPNATGHAMSPLSLPIVI